MIKQKELTQFYDAIEKGEAQVVNGNIYHKNGLAYPVQVEQALIDCLTGKEYDEKKWDLLDESACYLYLTTKQAKTLKRKGVLTNVYVPIRVGGWNEEQEDLWVKVDSISYKKILKVKHTILKGAFVVKSIDDISRLS